MIDSVAAAQAALTGKRISVATHRDGRIEALPVQTDPRPRRTALGHGSSRRRQMAAMCRALSAARWPPPRTRAYAVRRKGDGLSKRGPSAA